MLLVLNDHNNGIHELWVRVQVEWKGIQVGKCQQLIENTPRRIQAVLKAKEAIPSTNNTQLPLSIQKCKNPFHDIAVLQ